MIKAVLWDFGGVFTTSPFESFNRYEKQHNIPKDFIRRVNATNPDKNAWARLESSQVTLDEFDKEFADETCAQGYEITGRQVIELLSGDLKPEMVKALKLISSSYKTACLTNNVKGAGEGPGMSQTTKKAEDVANVMSLFDVVVESSVVGYRKPDPRIYLTACTELNIEPEDAVFLDDLGINLKPARELGMRTIKVLSSEQSLGELEEILGMTLR
ncbi:MAG: HAD-IA family hydrolase [Gammaproteobacteria bacterium]|nr:HAD-IA family hydrolase [Gammaproteobacteria bacterium]